MQQIFGAFYQCEEYTCMLHILNKSENATLQFSIFYEKVLGKKYLLRLNNVDQTSNKRFVETTYLSRLMYELCSSKCLKLYSLKFAIAHAQIKIVMLIKISLNCVSKGHKKTA